MGLTVKYKLKETWSLKITPYLCTRKWYQGNRPGVDGNAFGLPPPLWQAEFNLLGPLRQSLPCLVGPAWVPGWPSGPGKDLSSWLPPCQGNVPAKG